MNKIGIITVLLLTFAGTVIAQDGNNTKYFLENMPGRFRLNPAYQPEYKTYIGLPGLSGISINYLNTGFNVQSVLRKNAQDSVYVDFNRFHKGLRRHNRIAVSNENALFTFGLRLKKNWYFTFDVTEKNDLLFSFNRDIFTFMLKGNTDYLGKTFDFGSLGLNGSLYSEFAVGLSKKVNDKLTVGGRVKFLRGIANVNSTKSKMSAYTSADGDRITLHSKQNIRVSAPLKYELSEDDFVDWNSIKLNDDKLLTSLINTRNNGFAVDLGGEYQFMPKLKFYASLLDLGFIRWGSNTHMFKQNTSFDWQGADISNSINPDAPGYKEIDKAFDNLLDSLKDNFRFSDHQGNYTTMLHTKLYAGATYEVHKMLNVGGLFKATMLGKTFYPSLTFSANSRLLRNLAASVSYSTMFGSYANIGFGLTAKLGPLQLFVVTDNVLAANFTRARSLSTSFGINILTGHKDFVKRPRNPRKRTDVTLRNTGKGNVYTIKKRDGKEKYSYSEVNVKGKKSDKGDEIVPKFLPGKDSIRIIRDTVLIRVEVPATGTSVVTPRGQYEYSVIVGSFIREKRALSLQKEFVRRGYPATRILKNNRGMFQVSLITYTDKEEALDTANQIREEYPQHDDVWLLEREL